MIKYQQVLILILTGSLIACSNTPTKTERPLQDGPPEKTINPAKISDPKPKHESYSKYGNPSSYTVLGKKYEVWDSHLGYEQSGMASWYGTKFHGQLTSSREPYDMYSMTAAHKHLPIPSYCKVTNLDNGKSIVVRVNDRGPFAHNRIIDLSYAAATKLDMLATGTARVKVESIDSRGPSIPQNENKVYLQVATFNERRNAETLASQIKKHSVAGVEINQQDTKYKVYVGPFNEESQAHALRDKLVELNLGKGLVVRRGAS